MAQLIKLEDYISRYEWNIYRYPTQYIRMKQENWKKLYRLWETEMNEQAETSELEQSAFSKWKLLFKRNKVETRQRQEDPALPATEYGLKQYFLDQLFPFQLKWASSTVTDVSFIKRGFERDQTLQYFLQRFPDTYFVMYYPIFKIQKVPMDGEIIFISPFGVEIIYLLEKGHETIHAVDSRVWILSTEREQKKIISPLIALKRTEKIIKSVLQKQEIDFPVTKTVLSRTNRIDSANQAYNLNIIDNIGYEQWFQEKRHFVSPLKNRQLKTAEALLTYCQTTSVKRPEWEEDMNGYTMDGGE